MQLRDALAVTRVVCPYLPDDRAHTDEEIVERLRSGVAPRVDFGHPAAKRVVEADAAAQRSPARVASRGPLRSSTRAFSGDIVRETFGSSPS
jgi:hypothetical protein